MELSDYEITKIQEWLHKGAKASAEDCPVEIREPLERDNHELAERVLFHLVKHVK